MRRLTTTLATVTALCLALNATASAAPPAIVKTSFSHLTTNSVTLEALVDPQGKEARYHFEYGTAKCAPGPCTKVPLPEGKIPAVVTATGDLKEKDETIINVAISSGAFAPGDEITGIGIPALTKVTAINSAEKTLTLTQAASASGTAVALTATGPQPVSVPVSGLSPGTTYHLRLVTSNGEKVEGPETTFTTYRLPQVFEACPNDAFRAGRPSGALPDCRAYEQASPVQKNAVDALGRVAFVRASVSGDAISFVPSSGIPGGEGAQEQPISLARRGADTWSTQGLLPPESAGTNAKVLGWTPDFGEVFDSATKPVGAEFDTSFLARSSAGGSLTPIVPNGSGLSGRLGELLSFAGTSANGSEVIFESESKLSSTPAALAEQPNVYVWDRATNKLSLASALNSSSSEGESPPEGAFAGAYDWIGNGVQHGGASDSYYTQDNHAITASGDVYFTAAGSGQLYLRRNPTQAQSALDLGGKCTEPTKACTLHVSASQRTVGGGAGGTDSAGAQPAAFMGASVDGSNVLLASSEKLTNDATTGPEPGVASIASAKLGSSEAEEANLDFIPASASGLVTEGSFVYWATPNKGTIGRAKLDGGEVKESFISGLGRPRWLAADSKYLYWSDLHGGKDGKGTIGRVELSGANPEPEFIADASGPQGLAVSASKVYWASEGSPAHSIARANIDGSGIEAEWHLVGGGEFPQGVAVDASHVYWGTNNGVSGVLRRIDLDGANEIAKGILGKLAEVRGIAIDAGHLYWASQALGEIGRSDLDLGEFEPEFIGLEGEGDLQGLAVAGGQIYWSINGESPPNTGNDLYRYLPATGALKDLTVDKADPNGAEVKGVLGTSKDASYVYFAANGVPDGVTGSPNAAGEVAEAGDCQGGATVGISFSGACNLYLAREGQPTLFIARLEAEPDASDWLPHGGLASQLEKTARVTADGQTLLFSSKAKLGPYDNEGIPELYRYRVGAAGPSCVSCDPGGAPASGGTGFGSVSLSTLYPPDPALVLSRNLSADGNRAFFETTAKLVGEDTNGEGGCPRVGSRTFQFPTCLDAYEWEAKGSGSCHEDMQGGGCIYLLSTGKSTSASFIADASESGNDVFLITRSAGLVRQDQDQLYDVYDAHVGGGLAAQEAVAPVPCEGEACKGGAKPPAGFESPASSTFKGPGNPKPSCPKGKRKVRSKGKSRCVAKKQHKSQKHKHKRAAKKSGRASR
jgi:virginiamycin B lyase